MDYIQVPPDSNGKKVATIESVDGEHVQVVSVRDSSGSEFDSSNPLSVEALSLPLPSGASTEATLEAIRVLTAEVRNLSETILYYISSTLEKMPRLDAADRIIINGSEITQTVTISSGTVTTLSDQTNIGGRPASNMAVAISNSGAQYLYDNLLVT